jgi:hypothetical protein
MCFYLCNNLIFNLNLNLIVHIKFNIHNCVFIMHPGKIDLKNRNI